MTIELKKYIPSQCENLPFNEALGVQSNADYFWPLVLRLDESEKKQFLSSTKISNVIADVRNNRKVLVNLMDARELFPATIKETNRFLQELNVKVTAFNFFIGDKNLTSWSIHKDGTKFDNKYVGLEARLSYYELAEAPGIIRWWTDEDMPCDYVDTSTSNYNRQNKFYIIAKVANELRNGSLKWDSLPAVIHETSTATPSAILRTNHPHHVIQGNGLRLTLGGQITFLDGNPVGVWEHLRTHMHKII